MSYHFKKTKTEIQIHVKLVEKLRLRLMVDAGLFINKQIRKVLATGQVLAVDTFKQY